MYPHNFKLCRNYLSLKDTTSNITVWCSESCIQTKNGLLFERQNRVLDYFQASPELVLGDAKRGSEPRIKLSS